MPPLLILLYEPRCEKTGLQGFRPGPTQTGLGSHRRWIETRNFGFRKKRNCSIRAAKNKGAGQLRGNREADLRLCFAYAKIRFSHDATKAFKGFKAEETLNQMLLVKFTNLMLQKQTFDWIEIPAHHCQIFIKECHVYEI